MTALNDLDHFFQAADDNHVKREKSAARKLRRSQWWKNVIGRGTCYYCGTRVHPHELTMDHKTPVIRGGRSTKSNVVACCKECNSRKKYLLPSEWNAYLEGRLGEENNADPADSDPAEDEGQ